MFTLTDSGPRPTRREFLRIGSLALGGLTLPGLLALRAPRRRGRPADNELTGRWSSSSSRAAASQVARPSTPR